MPKWHTTSSPKQHHFLNSHQKKRLEWAGQRPKSGSLSSLTPSMQSNTNLYLSGRLFVLCVEVLKRLKGRVNWIRPGIAANRKLHHGNALSNTCLRRRWLLSPEYLCNISPASPHPHSLDIAVGSFFLFPQVKRELKRHCHGTIAEVKSASVCCLDVWEKDFWGIFQVWTICW